MILLEIPKATLVYEIVELMRVNSGSFKDPIFADGAVAALHWLLGDGEAPSKILGILPEDDEHGC
jgi:hypothetical protein